MNDMIAIGYSPCNGTYDVFDVTGACLFYGNSDEVNEWLTDNGYEQQTLTTWEKK